MDIVDEHSICGIHFPGTGCYTYQRLESGERNILTSSFGLACRVIEALDMDASKFYHGDYYLEEEVKTMRGKGIASRKKSSI